MTRLLDQIGVSEIACFHSYADVENSVNKGLNYDLAFLDVNLGINARSGIDVYHLLLQHHFKGKIVFLTGHASSYPLLQKMLENPQVRLLEKPADISVIEAIVRE